jgi:hypothetical protein
MSRQTITIEQFETGLDWTPLVRAAGLLSDKQHSFQIYLLAGLIIRDEEVSYRVTLVLAAELLDDDEPVTGSASVTASAYVANGAYEKVLREMTDAERAALKVRIMAKLRC